MLLPLLKKNSLLRAGLPALLLALLLTVGTRPAHATLPPFTTDTTIDSGNTAYDGQDIVVNGCTVTINGVHPFASLLVTGNGTVNHTAGLVGGMNLTISGNVTIASGSSLNATGDGYGSGQGPGAGGADTTGGNGGAGASYGGEGRSTSGAAAGPVYGDIKLPTDLGSGGGAGYAGGYIGAAGGGAIHLTVGGTLQVDGRLSSDGNGNNRGGAGSGGSLLLNVGSLAGAGAITAYGGGASYNGGAGSGGRIALYYGAKTFTGALSAAGASSDYGVAGAGTVFLKQSSQTQGDLIVDNNGNAGLGTPLVGMLTFDNVTVRNQGMIVPLVGQVLTLTTLKNMTIAQFSYLNADGRGYGSGQGPGAGGSDTTGAYGGAGASYGGEGRPTSGATEGPVYGDIKLPIDLGSGGGVGRIGTNPGSEGGGGVHLTVGGTLQVDGRLSADGYDRNNGGGGGSGGSLLLTVGTLAGAGAITANGGGAGYNGGAGSGGRIALYYGAKTFTGALSAAGAGSDYGVAGAGTVFLKQSSQTQGDLVVDNNGNVGLGTPLVAALTFDNVTVRNQGVIVPLVGQVLTLTTIGNVTVESGGFINADGRGYGPGQGPGAGGNDNTGSYGGGGGGYGGAGRDTSGAKGGAANGSQTPPLDFGSGGGKGRAGGNIGSEGGGAVHLTVGGTLQVDGLITANGYDRNNGGGGGSGGSLLLNVGALAGTGAVTAYGGGAGYNGGGGGGGRIVLLYQVDNFTGNLSAAAGGSDYGPATDGVITQTQTAGHYTLTLAVSPTSVAGGQNVLGTVTLSAPAPAGGLDVALQTTDPAAPVPPDVTVPEGQTSATFNVAVGSVSQTHTASLSAHLYDQVGTATLTINPWLGSVRLNPTSAISGESVTGTLTLNVPAPGGGLTVSLASSSPAVTLPATLKIAGGLTTATFTAKVGMPITAASVTVTVSYLSEKKTATLYVTPTIVRMRGITLSPSSAVGGTKASGIIMLTGAAPTGGAIVALNSANPTLAAVPAFVTVPAGRSAAAFTVTTSNVASPTTVFISGSLGSTLTATLTVRPPGVAGLALVPTVATGGDTVIGVVTLDAPSAASVVVTITSSSLKAVPDTSIVILPGDLTGYFFIDTAAVSATTTAMITAKANGISKSQALTINP